LPIIALQIHNLIFKMIILIFLVSQWYASLFFQSIFHHRYSAHGMFKMSKVWERVFYLGCFFTQGSSYISANTYGIMHLFTLMWQTRCNYINIFKGKTAVEERYRKDLPSWESFERLVHTIPVRFLWIVVYIAFYFLFATSWWMFLFLPFTIAMGSLQGASVNWWAHRFGYVNFKQHNTSKNILPVDFIFWGEAYHNNHHHHPGRPNNASRWFEFDMGFFVMKLLDKLKIIKLVSGT
jgi:stearoyl-CoA desaturase (Delta-9 desaturase)